MNTADGYDAYRDCRNGRLRMGERPTPKPEPVLPTAAPVPAPRPTPEDGPMHIAGLFQTYGIRLP